jgi:S1-C subfamily serine protease
MSEDFKQSCQFCSGHVSYSQQYVGRTIPCPHCGEAIKLSGGLPPNPSEQLVANAAQSSDYRRLHRFASPRIIVISVLLIFLVVLAGVSFHVVTNRAIERKQREVKATRAKAEADRIKAEAEKANAEIEMAKLKRVEEVRATAKAEAEAQALALANDAKQELESKARAENERKLRIKDNPAVLALWEEQDHQSVRIITTRQTDATLKHKGSSFSAKYDDMPEWFRTSVQTKHREDGETKGLIREINGKTYDLRTSPGGWLMLPMAEVIQIVEDGYLVIDIASLNDRFAQTKVFKLKHNGLARILNTGDRIQVTAMSAGTFTYTTKNYEVKTVPVYDPGVPLGPLREKVVSMQGKPERTGKRTKYSSDEPIGSGSGFFVSEDGLFITNAHVVEEGTRVEVRTSAGKKRATVLRLDKDKDLALLRVLDVAGTVPALSISTNSATLGGQVFTIGYPLVELQGSRPKFTDGKVSSLAGMRDDPDQMQISVPVQPGNSGGPLTDMNGDVVGVVVARLNDVKVLEAVGSLPQNVNYAIKGTTLIRFLSENKSLAVRVSIKNSPPRNQDAAIQTVETASGLVLIYQ